MGYFMLGTVIGITACTILEFAITKIKGVK